MMKEVNPLNILDWKRNIPPHIVSSKEARSRKTGKDHLSNRRSFEEKFFSSNSPCTLSE
jgi:hypothetical protein